MTTNPEAGPASNPAAMETGEDQAPTEDRSATRAPVEHPAADQPAAAKDAVRVRRRGLFLWPVLVAALTAFVVATGYLAIRDRRPAASAPRWGSSASAEPDWQAAGVPNPFGTQAAALHGAPTRLKVKAIGVDTALETLKIGKSGELDPPTDFAEAGWYAAGTAPGDLGPAVIAGHVDNQQGPAVFYRLRELQAGDKIQVVRGGATVNFTVTSTAWYPKTAFPTGRVYGPTPDRELRLITCGGVFDHALRSYTDNLVVYAVTG
jgi:hypothetical protein